MNIEGCIFPEDLLYNLDNNTWLRNDNGGFLIGINSFLAWFSGKFINVRFFESKILEFNSIICSLEAVRRFDVIRAPFKCELLEVNKDLLTKPILLNKDPYGKGWIAKLKPLESTIRISYKNINELKEEISRKISDYKIKCFSEYPDYEFFEIGVECSLVLAKLNELFSNSEIGTVVHIVSDDPTAPIEMMRWQEQTGQKFVEYKKEGNLYHLIAKKIK
jgi:glycine cleavage system H protein